VSGQVRIQVAGNKWRFSHHLLFGTTSRLLCHHIAYLT